MAKRLIRNFREWISRKRWRVVTRCDDIDDVPEQLGRRDVAIVASPDFVKWVVFDCPCRTGHRIMLNADQSRKPYWTLVDEDLATISPSIDFNSPERRCHYFVRAGRTLWAGDSD